MSMSVVNNNSSFSNDIKELTIKIQNCFLGTDHENLKWSLLYEFKSKYLVNEHFSNAVVTSYIIVISTLIDSFKPNLIVNKSQESLFEEMFLKGVHHESFLLLVNRLNKSEVFVEQKIMKLLLTFFRGFSLEALLMYQCRSHRDWDLKFVSKSNVWDILITALISLPERIANKTGGHFLKIFSPSCYTSLLFSSVLKVLSSIHNSLQNSQDCSVEFLAKLTGRLCMIGNADMVAKKYAKVLINVSESDFIWRRMSRNFITKLPPNTLDSFITHLLLSIPWYGYVAWILGDEGVKNVKINYIMTVKLLFVKYFKQQDHILQNIIGYFASSSDSLSHFLKIVDSLLDSWADKRSLRCQNADQKIYLASALMVCAGWIGQQKQKVDTEYIGKILQGTELRLESTEETTRSQGMIVADNFIGHISPDSPPFQFEHKDREMLEHLKGLLRIPEKPVDSAMNYEDLKCFEDVEIERSEEETESATDQNSHASTVNIELLDSDDELEAYDMSPDTAVKTKRPLYLRDCMKGLIEQDDAEYTEQCLIHAEELIKKNPYARQEVAEEMTKVVLHLDNKFDFDNFVGLRHKILITLTIESPVVVSAYLISQFCARDYNIRQRLDILEVLAASSLALSSADSSMKALFSPSIKDPIAEKEADWKLIIQKRIEAKTRRFTKADQPVLRENKFSAIAGLFFFPLLGSYDRRSSSFDVSKDNYVLGRFVSTLGMIMHAATNTAHCREMGTTFLQFLASVRTNADVFVRQSVLLAVAATYISVPSSVLFSEMMPQLIDTNAWLQNVIEKDVDSSCIEKAICTLNILQDKAKEECSSLSFGGLVIPGS